MTSRARITIARVKRLVVLSNLISRSAAADIITLAGRETRLRTGEKVNDRAHLLGPPCSPQWNPRHHVVNRRLRNSVEYRCVDDRRRNRVDGDVALSRYFLGD